MGDFNDYLGDFLSNDLLGSTAQSEGNWVSSTNCNQATETHPEVHLTIALHGHQS